MAQSKPEELVARALESLSSEERQQATTWLLTRQDTQRVAQRVGWLSRQLASDPMLAASGQNFLELYARGMFGGPGTSVEKAAQMVPVPVRLPGELHARLREWSAEHGFSMATVVRGLVSKFLDGQEAGEAAPEM